MQDFQGKVQQVSLSGFHQRTIFRKKWGLTERRGSQLPSPAIIKGYFHTVAQLCPGVSISSQIVKPAWTCSRSHLANTIEDACGNYLHLQQQWSMCNPVTRTPVIQKYSPFHNWISSSNTSEPAKQPN